MSDEKDKAQLELLNVLHTFEFGTYVHYKGGKYMVTGLSVMEDTLDVLVHYCSLEKGTHWTRTYKNFTELVNGVPRFKIFHGIDT
jgi:hypothetical protein